MRAVLIDRDARLVAAWREAFRDVDAVEAVHGDLAIRETLGVHVEQRVRERIRDRHHGELPVGVADIVATDDSRWPLLVCAPTMRVPEDASRSINAYLAFRAVLLALRRCASRGAKRRKPRQRCEATDGQGFTLAYTPRVAGDHWRFACSALPAVPDQLTSRPELATGSTWTCFSFSVRVS